MTSALRSASGFAEFTRHVNPVFGHFLEMTGRDLHLVEAHGTTLVNTDGRTFDDWTAGFGVFNLGHNPPAIVAALHDALDAGAPNIFAENVNPSAGALGQALAAAAGAPFEIASFCNSGSEAVEAAIKTALLATGRKRIVYADGAYHGTTLGALACSGKGPYREPFEGQLHDFTEVPFGDADAVGAALARGDVAAFLVEPVQMEGGVRVAPVAYLQRVADLCNAHGALLLFDEVQCGMGRSGRLFAYQALGLVPDVVILAKALGGGCMPIGATLMPRKIWTRAWGTYLRCEAQSTTFGGNTLACRAALATLQIIADDAFLATVRARSEELFTALRARIGGSRFVKQISSLGLMGGIELRDPDHPWLGWDAIGLPELRGKPVSGPLIVDRLQRAGILTQVCGHDWSVVRVEPPLIVSRETCGRFIDAFGDAVHWLETNA